MLLLEGHDRDVRGLPTRCLAMFLMMCTATLVCAYTTFSGKCFNGVHFYTDVHI